MWNAQTQSRQTNKDRHQRRYRLSPSGLTSLRATALRNKPWLLSTGPRTATGKARSELNATKHGERSAQSRAAWRALNAALRAVNRGERQHAASLEGIAQKARLLFAEEWVLRIADELRLS